jgi:hypothetical protein
LGCFFVAKKKKKIVFATKEKKNLVFATKEKKNLVFATKDFFFFPSLVTTKRT